MSIESYRKKQPRFSTAWRMSWPGMLFRRALLTISERKLILLAGDVVLINLSLLLAVVLAPALSLPLSWHTLTQHLAWYVSLTGLWCAVSVGHDVYNLRVAARHMAGPIKTGQAVVVTALLYFLLPYISAPLTATRLSWLLFLLSALALLGFWRYLYARVVVQPQFRQPLLIVGTGAVARTLGQAVQACSDEYQLVGFVESKAGSTSSMPAEMPVLGEAKDLLHLVKQHRIREIGMALAPSQCMGPELFEAIMNCEPYGVHVTTMVDMYERLTGRIPLDLIEQQVEVLSPYNQTAVTPVYLITKRALDISIAIIGLMALLLLLPLLAIAIKLDSAGPIVYWQRRVGQHGRSVWIAKLRTMGVDAEKDGQAIWATRDDNRITRFGRFARRVHLDEVPQLWSVLKGDMTLVGPRPERPELEVELERAVPFYRSRHLVKPGLTGWSQINFGNTESIDDVVVKLQYDLYYIKHRSFWLDIVILLRTVSVVLGGQGT